MTSDKLESIMDYDRMAAVFDRFLPFLEPVTTALLERLPTLPKGARVLDVACGTGEPGLTLARQRADVQLLGIDTANGMIQVARSKVSQHPNANASFEGATAEALPCAEGSVDAVVSRFGLLMFGDVPASARELARVLRSGGSFSIAAWDSVALNTVVDVVMTVLRPYLSASQWAPVSISPTWPNPANERITCAPSI